MVRSTSDTEQPTHARARIGRPRVNHAIVPCTVCGGPRTGKYARCRGCQTATKRAWRHANPEKARAALRSWCGRNKDKVVAYAHRSYQKNKARYFAQAYKWGRENKQKRSRIMSFQNTKRRSRKKANGGRGYTKAQWRDVCQRAGGLCAYCRENEIGSLDHFVPLALGGPHDFANIVPACARCNSTKRENEPNTWVAEKFGHERLAFVKSILLA